MSDEHSIEVSLNVEVQAGLAFRIDKVEWEGMDTAAKRQKILEQINLVNGELDYDILYFQSGASISMTILGPEGLSAQPDLDQIEIYDPREE